MNDKAETDFKLPVQPSSPIPVDSKLADSPKAANWITDRAWICGVIGAFTVIMMAYWYNSASILQRHVTLFGWQITDERNETLLFALVVVTLSMLISETVRLYLRDTKNFFKLDPDLQNNFFRFVVNCIFNYLLWFLLLWLAVSFYRSGNEYGYFKNAPYYQCWFTFIETALWVYGYFGLPYVFITRAVKYDPLSDKRELATTAVNLLTLQAKRVPMLSHIKSEFDHTDKKNLRGLVVKMFFTPLMTVFFCDQFGHLVNNVGYILEGLPNAIANGNYSHSRFNSDTFNISMSLIFSIDVALAWCGYVISSRWVDNQTHSAEPTWLGWIVCIACYPPFQFLLSAYYYPPSDRSIFQLPDLWIVSVFTVMMAFSYIVYMSATLWFGVRFSNLTNRGIIRKGPFAFIRHPAYASKNFSWWLVMFPYCIWLAFQGNTGQASFFIMGLIIMTTAYYWRAITEERHLMADPYYQEYCKQVRYRFIPKLF